MATSDFDHRFARAPVMAILRGLSVSEAIDLAQRAWDLGIDTVEVTIEVPSAVPVLRTVVAAGRERGHEVGAGSVVDLDQVREAADAGAAFSVAPGLDATVARASIDAGMPHLPGVATPTDVQAALANGMSWVKAFPASVLGADWVDAVRQPFPGLQIVATGGIDARNAGDFLAAGARAVAVGSALADPAQVELLARLITGDGPEGTAPA
jgi:2-dehydro-3-deoxyphosphogluconate aldolase / (4S)-4-hydroxy-2-oxoglutarate aldolase